MCDCKDPAARRELVHALGVDAAALLGRLAWREASPVGGYKPMTCCSLPGRIR